MRNRPREELRSSIRSRLRTASRRSIERELLYRTNSGLCIVF